MCRDLLLVDLAHAQPEGDVLAHRHVLEQRVALEHEPQPALLRRQVGDVVGAEQMVPASGCSSPAITRSTVDLPDPDGPSNVVMPPAGAVNDTSATAGVPRAVNRLVRFLTTRLKGWPP